MFQARVGRLWAGIVLFLLIITAAQVKADDDELDYGKVYAIQLRTFRMNHEFSFSLGFMPLDAFYKMFSVGGHYVLHFDDLWAWEAIHLSFSKYMSVDTGLKADIAELEAAPTSPEEKRIDLIVDTNIMFKPMYGKTVLFDSTVVHSQSFFLMGAGAEKFETAWYPAINIGVGLRIFMGQTLSMRMEVREYVYFGEGGFGSTLLLAFGFSYNAFAEDRRVPESMELSK